ncbi:MAG TPA: hypothetical protein VN770_07075 [Gaiellaceae bacterium]|nr:hypothetical protein [Gaiellaceae bacterium]
MRALATILTAGVVAGAPPNGEASKSPAAILADAKTAATSASAVRISGSIVTGSGTITLDLVLVAPDRARGRMSEEGESFDVVRVGKTVYIRGSRAFYTKVAGKQAAALLQGKWLSAPATTGKLASIGEFTDIRTFFTGVLGSHGHITRGAETTVGGQKVIALVDHSNSGGTLYVATTGRPYPMEIASPHGGAAGAVHFTGWGASIRITAPKNAIDLSKLKSGG